MNVAVSYRAAGLQAWLHVSLPEGASVREAIAAAGILQRQPSLQLEVQRVGVSGCAVNLDAVLRAGDRLEIVQVRRRADSRPARRPCFALND